MPGAWNRSEASTALVDIAQGMALLVHKAKLPKTIRMQRQMHEILVAEDISLWSVLQTLQKSNATRDEARFWLGLAQKLPLLTDLPASVSHRLSGCEPSAEMGMFGQALVLCVHQAAVAISFPSEKKWDADQLLVHFTEILPDSNMEAANELIDNVARSSHANRILERYGKQQFTQLTPATFWRDRAIAFPALRFGNDVEEHLTIAGGNQFLTIMHRLDELNASAAKWQADGGAAPNWHSKVTPEAETLRNNPQLAKTRKFKNAQGVPWLYTWHARFGSGGRIHLRFDATDRSVEIGYIGAHLP